MVAERAPFSVRAVPDKGERQLAEEYGLCGFFTGDKGGRYLDWLGVEEQTLATILGYRPLSTQLKKRVAMALSWEPEFDSHLLSMGIVNFSADHEKVKLLTKLGAAILVTHYYDRANGLTV